MTVRRNEMENEFLRGKIRNSWPLLGNGNWVCFFCDLSCATIRIIPIIGPQKKEEINI